MENRAEIIQPEVKQLVDTTGLVIDRFRSMYTDSGAQELERMPLIAHHDPSIFFTNSTTSVMKPYLQSTDTFDTPLFLTQPAVGSQGIHHWQANKTLGPFASYFFSLGALYHGHQDKLALSDMVEVVSKHWSINPDYLLFEVHRSDEALQETLRHAGVQVAVVDGETDDFRHSYGLHEVHGENANLMVQHSLHDTARTLGNLTLIVAKDEPDRRYWEVSYDSTTVVELITGADHAINALPITALVNTVLPHSTESLVTADCATISSALALEGLQPRAKGKAGIMRKFFKEFVAITEQNGLTKDEQSWLLQQAMLSELELRNHLSPEPVPSVDYTIGKSIVNDWLDKLSVRE